MLQLHLSDQQFNYLLELVLYKRLDGNRRFIIMMYRVRRLCSNLLRLSFGLFNNFVFFPIHENVALRNLVHYVGVYKIIKCINLLMYALIKQSFVFC